MAEFLGTMSADSSGDEDDPLQELVQSLAQEDKMGPDWARDQIHQNMRDKEETAKVLSPENCPNLAKFNPDIWALKGGHTQHTDLTLQRVQTSAHKGIIPMLRALEKAKDKRDKDCVQLLDDTFRLLAMGSAVTSQARKDNIAEDLNKAFRSLCVPIRPVTSLHSGDDLTKVIKDI